MRHICKTLLLLCAGMLLLSSCGNNNEWKQDSPKNKIKGVISYRRSFGDLNKVHLSSAKKIGISPIDNREDIDKKEEKLMYIGENPYYSVDKLTHSIPYLVPKASALLMTIGMNFQDSLWTKGLDKHKIIVTSVLRTKDDVKRLRKTNSNASLNSAHFYGTTFDISYNRFDRILPDGKSEEERDEKLKLVLSEVLRDLKKAGLCYIKYELRQGCFHIAAR